MAGEPLASGYSAHGLVDLMTGIEREDSEAAGTIGIISSFLARFTDFSQCLLALIRPPTARVAWVQGMDVCGNLNHLARLMRGEWLWLLGDDHTFAPDTLVRLLTHLEDERVDAVVPLCLKKQAPFEPVVYGSSMVNPEDGLIYHQLADLPEHGLVEVHACGSAGMLLRRSMLDELPKPIFETSDGMQNEDFILCKKIRERRERLGLPGSGIFCDVDVAIGHIGLMTVLPMWQGGPTVSTRYGTMLDLGGGHMTPLFAMDPEDMPELDEALAEVES